MNRRITKKHYKSMLAELAEEKEYVGAQLAEVNEMRTGVKPHAIALDLKHGGKRRRLAAAGWPSYNN